jgi:hypothetical protein
MCRLMADREDDLEEMLREVSKSLNQPIQQLGERQAARVAAMVGRDVAFQESVVRAEYAQQLLRQNMADRRAAYAKHKQLLRESSFTAAQLQAFIAGGSKMLGAPEETEPVMVAAVVVAEAKKSEAAYPDLRHLLSADTDDLDSVVSGSTQRTVVGVAGVLTTSDDYVKHAAVLRAYVGDRRERAIVRYPEDAQQAFDKYAGAAILRYDRNLTHARDLHAYNDCLKEYKLLRKEGTDALCIGATKEKLESLYRVAMTGNRRFADDTEQLRARERKAVNTALLARAVQPSWQSHTSAAFQSAIQLHDPPDGYGHRSTVAVFWINMHRLAIGDVAFTAAGFESLAGDAI